MITEFIFLLFEIGALTEGAEVQSCGQNCQQLKQGYHLSHFQGH